MSADAAAPLPPPDPAGLRPASTPRPSSLPLGLFLALLVGLPLAWLAYYALTDATARRRSRTSGGSSPTRRCARRSRSASWSRPASACSRPRSRRRSRWLAARTNMPGTRLRARAGDARRSSRRPSSAPSPGRSSRRRTAASSTNGTAGSSACTPFEHLLDIYSVTGLVFVDACYTFPFVFVLVANGLDRIPGDIEDASAILGAKPWRTAWRITLPLALPAVLAGMMVAFLQLADAVRHAGDPGAAGRLPHHHDEDLEPVPVPAEPGARRRGLDPAARAHHPAAAGRALGARAAQLRRDRRQEQPAAAGRPQGLALAGARALPRRAVQPGLPALSRARADRAVEDHRRAADAGDDDAAARALRLLRVLADAARAAEHRHPRGRDRDRRHGACARHRLCGEPQGHRRPPGARLPRDGADRRCRASSSASACSSPTRAGRWCSTGRCGSCSSPT